MVYIVSTMLRKAFDFAADEGTGTIAESNDAWWKKLMLAPVDYGKEALHNETTRGLMERIVFIHGGPEYDERYPDGIPTSIRIELEDGRELDSGFVMYPSGHARNTTCDLKDILAHKAELLGGIAMDAPADFIDRTNSIGELDADGLLSLFDCRIDLRQPID